ncbi:hypothetical protein BPC006_I3238 [Burkholderia pseudomallei BPC006]|uniref:Uncharacterized protein n=1 Tax=Burkholderia pseudomallei (strain 1710b) TaxID=320372 RepID=Q3JPB9_BURP1|nr:hypothetical protein BURPS1710b_3212 [Burkholderia pseudomallei 1710b]AFR17084.1 hypothetical protein BPC006_I3238 [Burkholderia pseudomallei BPC006]
MPYCIAPSAQRVRAFRVRRATWRTRRRMANDE